jgi:hypothetical protein
MFAARNMTFARTSGFTPASLNPLLWFDASVAACYSGSGTAVNDIGGAGNNGTLVNGVTYTATDGGAFVFASASSQYINLASIASGSKLNGKSGYAAAAFLKTTAGQRAPFSYGQSGVFTTDILFGMTSTRLLSQVNNSADGGAEYIYTIPAGYFHYAVVFDGTQTGNANRLKIYVNGVLQTSTYTYTVPATTGSPATPLARIGSYVGSPAGWYMQGSIANIVVFDKAISQTDVTNIYNHGRTRLGL